MDLQVQNLKASILYLQESHAEILKSLHKEIETLQSKNSTLQFELSMIKIGDVTPASPSNAPSAAPSVVSDANTTREVEAKLHKLQQRFSEIETENKALRENTKICSLRLAEHDRTVCKLHEAHRRAIHTKERCIDQQNAELQLKSDRISALSGKLHAIQRELAHLRELHHRRKSLLTLDSRAASGKIAKPHDGGVLPINSNFADKLTVDASWPQFHDTGDVEVTVKLDHNHHGAIDNHDTDNNHEIVNHCDDADQFQKADIIKIFDKVDRRLSSASIFNKKKNVLPPINDAQQVETPTDVNCSPRESFAMIENLFESDVNTLEHDIVGQN